jgi:hypothetical protein
MANEPQNSELERPCSECLGECGEQTEAGWEPCWICNGTGFVATPLGQQILQLMRHNFRQMFERIQNGDD